MLDSNGRLQQSFRNKVSKSMPNFSVEQINGGLNTMEPFGCLNPQNLYMPFSKTKNNLK